MPAYSDANTASLELSCVSARCSSAALRAASRPAGRLAITTGGSITKPPICAVLWPSVP
jgi:hypothetical protein